MFSYEVSQLHINLVMRPRQSQSFCLVLQAVDRLNIKTKNFRDLLTDEVFTKADIITLQDPSHPEQFDLSTFHYVKNKLAVTTGVCFLIHVLKKSI